jgi:hypothetical protein
MAIEFRELTDGTDRKTFINRVAEARTAHGKQFRFSQRLQAANRARLQASTLYGLFRDFSDSPDRMIAGIAMHDLKTFPQSCSDPDLSHLLPHTVVECSDHWSLSSGAGMLAWAGLAVPMRLLGIKAVLAYLASDQSESDHAGFYSLMGFLSIGSAVPHPFVEAETGGYQYVQPVLLYGAALNNVINAFAEACIGMSADARTFLLKPRVRPLVRYAAAGRTKSMNQQAMPVNN